MLTYIPSPPALTCCPFVFLLHIERRPLFCISPGVSWWIVGSRCYDKMQHSSASQPCLYSQGFWWSWVSLWQSAESVCKVIGGTGHKAKGCSCHDDIKDDINARRESLIKVLRIWVKDNCNILVQEFMDLTEATAQIEKTTVNIYLQRCARQWLFWCWHHHRGYSSSSRSG